MPVGSCREVSLVVDLTFLGTGTSTGVPVIGCGCETCLSTDPRDTRLRASVLIETEGKTILIDTSPDLRVQMLRTGTDRIDAVLFTHAHADHTAGLDELRRFNVMQMMRIPVWATEATARELKQRFSYAFDHSFSYFGGKPDLDLHQFDEHQPFSIDGLTVTPIAVFHGRLPIVGFRIGDVAYVTDVRTIPDASAALLQDLDVLVLTALRQDPHPAHLSLAEALDVVADLRPRRTFLTHIAHDMGRQADVETLLPEHVQIATDGLAVVSDRIGGNPTRSEHRTTSKAGQALETP